MQHILFNLMVAFVLIPALGYTVTDNLQEKKHLEREIESSVAVITTQIGNHLSLWQQQHLFALTELAKVAADSPMQPSADLQMRTEHFKRSYPDFVIMYIGNSLGTSIAYYPPADAKGVSSIGQSFADREYFQVVKSTQQPGISDIFMGRAGAPFPTVALTVPILEGSHFRGYVSGGLDINYIKKLLKLYALDGQINATLLDGNNRVIASTRPDNVALQSYDAKKGGEIQIIGKDSYRWLPVLSKLSHETVRWQKAIYIKQTKPGKDIPWTVIIEYPYGQDYAKAMDNNIKKLMGILALTMLALFFANIFSTKLSSPLVRLALLTTDLPSKLFDPMGISWPETRTEELNLLVGNFKTMTSILSKNFQEINRQSAAIKASNDGIGILDQNGKHVYLNRAHVKVYGYNSSKELIGKSWKKLYDQTTIARFEQEILPKLYREGYWRGETVGKRQDGSLFPQEISLGFFVDGGIVIVVRDITQRKKNELAIWAEKERAQVTLHSIGDAVITTDKQGKIEYLNPVAEQLTGWTNQEASGKDVTQVFNIVNEQNGKRVESPVKRCLREGRIVGLSNHTSLIHHAGHQLSIEDSASPIKDREGNIIGAVLVFHDVSEKREMVQQLSYMAHHDSLTQLPNRIMFKDRLNVELIHAHRNKELLAVFFMDLDRFKQVNDMLGHAMGDELLKEIARRLTNCLREGDTVSRLGGDEFTILLPRLTMAEDAIKVAQKLIENLHQPTILGGQEFHITTSIGIAVYPNDGEDADNLLKNADTAMYLAKQKGGNSYQLFTQDMKTKIMAEIDLENSLRKAIKNNEFVVYYQPQVNIQTGKITGMEALVHWEHPFRGLIPPNDFIQAAEETGLIVPIGEWVLRTACAQMTRWNEAGYPPVRITVNLSARQLLQQKDLVNTVARILQETKLNPYLLELEITESTAMQDIEHTITTLQKLRAMGVQIAIDDFGTGYSSLNYLTRFPITTLKIDRSFVADITANKENAAIVTAIIGLGRNLSLNIIAEGVETEAQLSFLKAQQCIEMQGFLFSKALPNEEFERLFLAKPRKMVSTDD
jgi:diguanylate cyclase (GGDEF)-like protein/PAS domain S-box-containing protein